MQPEVKKVDLSSKDITQETKGELKKLIPSAFTEDGSINWDALKSVLGEVVEPSREFYNFTWAGKSEAFRTLQRPSTATLGPCEEESKEWDKTENLFIEGDNLEVLKLLQKTYHNSIKMIYIDPPYNKDKDFVYPDRWSEGIKSYKEFCGFVDNEGNVTTSEDEAKNAAGRKHSRWLTMMYPRLFLARNLLKDDGVIFVSIDDDEAANLKKMMDEIFGEENFVDCVIWKKRYGGGAKEKHLVSLHEYAYFYAKDKNQIGEIFVSMNPESIERYYKSKDEKYETRGGYRTHPLEAGKAMDERVNLIFPIKAPDGTEVYPKKQWLWSKDRVAEALQNNELEFINGKDGWSIQTKQYLKDEDGNIRGAKVFSIVDDVYTQHGTNEMLDIFGDAKIFNYPKPTLFLSKLLEIGSSENDIILDFFAGSGSTAHSIYSLNARDGGNRKFICVQIPEPTPQDSDAKKAGYKTIAEITKERIRRAGAKIKADNSLFTGDTGFKVFKLDESNFKQWDKEVADTETLKQQIMEFADNVSPEASKANMLYELLLKKGYSLNAKVAKKQIVDNEIFVVDGSMLVCLDDKISTATIDEVIKLRPAHFIVLDRAFEGNDQLKTNTWQTFKSLFPNDENPFETV